jgi:signal transduction histidine kinase
VPNKYPSEAGCAALNPENMLQDCLICGILAIDPKDKIVALTPVAEKLLGLPANQKYRSSSKTLPNPLQSIVREARKTGRTVADRKIVLRPGKGAPVTILATAMLVSPGKKTGSVAVLLKDLSPAGRMERNLRRLDRLASVGTLSASMAHEIKNALVAVKTFIDLLLEKNRDAELVEIVRREMGRVDSIVGQMLRFTAPAQPVFSTVSVHKVLDHSLRLIQHRAGGGLITFDRQFQASSDLLHADDYQLEQAFVNLFLNAVEAINSSGTLTVATNLTASPGGGQLREDGSAAQLFRIRIADTGIGIPPENMGRIFEPFFTTKQHGTGLGLPVTRRIIEEHGGVIQVESQPGKGTIFTVLLPASSEARA